MNFTEKNNFILKHASASFFETDRKIYAALFPESKLNADLKNANKFTHKKLDERMLLEILNVKDGNYVLKQRKETKTTAARPAAKAAEKTKPAKAQTTAVPAKKKPRKKAPKKKAARA